MREIAHRELLRRYKETDLELQSIFMLLQKKKKDN